MRCPHDAGFHMAWTLTTAASPAAYCQQPESRERRFLFDMRFLCRGLMSPPPERPCDDFGRLNSFLRETLGYAADFLDRPTDEVGCLGVALDFVFLASACWPDVGWQPS